MDDWMDKNLIEGGEAEFNIENTEFKKLPFYRSSSSHNAHIRTWNRKQNSYYYNFETVSLTKIFNSSWEKFFNLSKKEINCDSHINI